MASGESIAFAGRVVRFNRKGKMCFMHLKDRYGRLQVVVARDEVGEENYEIVKMTDLGDFIGVNGFMFETQTGEYSVHVKKVTMLSKAVRPLPVAKERWTRMATRWCSTNLPTWIPAIASATLTWP